MSGRDDFQASWNSSAECSGTPASPDGEDARTAERNGSSPSEATRQPAPAAARWEVQLEDGASLTLFEWDEEKPGAF